MWYRKPGVIILFILFFWLSSTVEPTAKAEGENETRQFTSEELQAAVMSFADTWAAQIGEAANALERQAATNDTRNRVERFHLYNIAAAFEIAAGPYPGPALLDMLVLAALNRIVWEEHWQPKVLGRSAERMGIVLKNLETEIWSVAANVLTSQQGQELRDLIRQWRKEHPDKIGVSFIRFSNFGELGRKPSLEKARKAGGLFAPVQEAVQAADEVRAMADRTIYLLVRMQEILSLRAKLTAQELLTTPEINKLLSDITGFREVSERYAELAENLPAQISDHTNAAIDYGIAQASLQSQEIINHLVQQVEGERRAALEQALQGISQEREATIEQMFQGLEVQRTVAIRQVLEGVAEERRAIMRDLTQLVDRGEREAEEGMTHIFILVAAIVFIFFLLRLAYRYAAEESAGTRHGRLAASVGLGVVAVLVVVVALTYVNRDLRKSSATAGTAQNTQDGDSFEYESSNQLSHTADTQGKVGLEIVAKTVPDAMPGTENSSQPSVIITPQKATTSAQESSLTSDPTADTRGAVTAEPGTDNAPDTGKPTSQPETVTNKKMPVTPKKVTLAPTPTSLQESETRVHPSTSEHRAQSTSGYEQIITKHFLFGPGEWQLKPESYETLDQVVTQLQQNVSLQLLIQGHSDSRGSEDLNKKLSKKRAEAIAAYLVQKGVSPDRLTTVGYASSQPVATNETSKGRAQNRRVVVKTIPAQSRRLSE